MASFGRLLKNERKNSAKTLGDVARSLGVKVSYLCDVENGRREALNDDRIEMATRLFGSSAETIEKLKDSARKDSVERRSQFRLPAEGTSRDAREVAAALERRWTQLTPEQLRELRKVVETGRGESENRGPKKRS